MITLVGCWMYVGDSYVYFKYIYIYIYMLTCVPADTEALSFSAREMSNVECFPPSESKQPAAPKRKTKLQPS